MGMNSGYKQTEVGTIPEVWDVKSVGSIASLKNGYAFKSQTYTSLGSYSVVTIANVQDGVMDITDCNKIDALPRDIQAHHRLELGDILISMTGNVGRVCRVTADNCLLNQRVGKLIPLRVNASFLFLLLGQRRFLQAMAGKAKGGAQGNLSVGDISDFLFPIPPTKSEQDLIVEALSDADALIESLEQLIAKKRMIKQGAMQELLMGKRRLPGFSGEWKDVYLKELLSFERPDDYIVQDTEYATSGTTPVLTANKSFVLGFTHEEFGICSDLPVIVFDDFTTDCKYADFPFKVKSSAIKLLRPKHSRVDLRFAFGRMQLLDFPLGDHKRYYISEYQNLSFAAPGFEEQQAIAGVLDDMEADIMAHATQLEKARQIKQGMMQELLTGRIRLV